MRGKALYANFISVEGRWDINNNLNNQHNIDILLISYLYVVFKKNQSCVFKSNVCVCFHITTFHGMK